MKILVCPDSYKETLTSIEVAEIISHALKRFDVITLPIGDGGDGTLDALLHTLKGKKRFVNVKDPLGRDIEAYYGIFNNMALIEMAQSSGLTLLKKNELNPWLTSTFGFGQLIRNAIEQKVKKIYLALGGSATNDFGVGMLQAFGVRFFDKSGKEILKRKEEGYGACILKEIYDFDFRDIIPLIKNIKFEVLCDVSNPLYGKKGSTKIYSAQKGADLRMTEKLEESIVYFHKLIKRKLKVESNFPGAGAAGGVGSALNVFLNAGISKGIDGVIKMLNIEDLIKKSDVVIVGEGSMDLQSSFGKAPIGIAELAKKYNKKVIAVNGRTDKSAEVFLGKQIDEIYNCFGNRKYNINYLKRNAVKNLKLILKELSVNLINLK